MAGKKSILTIQEIFGSLEDCRRDIFSVLLINGIGEQSVPTDHRLFSFEHRSRSLCRIFWLLIDDQPIKHVSFVLNDFARDLFPAFV